MTSTTAPTDAPEAKTPDTARQRDADGTRIQLLLAARRRFARDGYSSTTVRDIAADAGVNVALINRYFTSKEGLFETCLRSGVDQLGKAEGGSVTVDDMLHTMIGHVSGPPSGETSLQLLLLLRSSGDVGADEIRRVALQRIAESMATIAGWKADDADSSNLLLRAEVALSTALGVVLLRTTTQLEPLNSSGDDDLGDILREVFSALLVRR